MQVRRRGEKKNLKFVMGIQSRFYLWLGYYLAATACAFLFVNFSTFSCLNLTKFSICTIHFFANSSSVNRFADCRARMRIDTLSLSVRANAFSKPSANSVAVVA